MYQAIITKIESIVPHPNADRLDIVTVAGNKVITGRIDNKPAYSEEDLVIYFPEEGQLSEEYCEANDLYPRLDENGNKLNSGYIEKKNRRVRVIKLRGEKSEGLIMPLSSLEFTKADLSSYKVNGWLFDSINNIPICKRYESEATIRARQKMLRKLGGKVKSVSVPLFHEHQDTGQFRFLAEKIPAGAIITITEKVEGTSHRLHHGPVQKTEELDFQTIWYMTRMGYQMNILKTRKYQYVIGTRRTIVQTEKGGFYGDDSFRQVAAEGVVLHKGETLYSELAGYTTTGAYIQPSLSVSKIKDKDLRHQIETLFGKEIVFRYGCLPNQCREFVYHFTLTTEDGALIHMPFSYTVKRCREIGREHVPILAPSFVYDGNVAKLKAFVEDLTEKNIVSKIDPSHLSEGLCLHIQDESRVWFLKSKNFVYKVCNDLIKESSDSINIEEAS